jgi:hypothetical protein
LMGSTPPSSPRRELGAGSPEIVVSNHLSDQGPNYLAFGPVVGAPYRERLVPQALHDRKADTKRGHQQQGQRSMEVGVRDRLATHRDPNLRERRLVTGDLDGALMRDLEQYVGW